MNPETVFNSELRAILRAQGLGVLHIREADQPGPADLVIWQGQRLLAWAELKVGEHKVEPHQQQFLRERLSEGGNAYVITRVGVTSDAAVVSRYDVDHLVALKTVSNFRLEDWTKFFKSYSK